MQRQLMFRQVRLMVSCWLQLGHEKVWYCFFILFLKPAGLIYLTLCQLIFHQPWLNQYNFLLRMADSALTQVIY